MSHSSNPRYWAVIPAAGVGRRLGAAIPKQYLDLAGRPVIDWTLTPFVDDPRISGVWVALGAEDGYWSATAYASHAKVRRIEGGAERCHSVLNALEALRDAIRAGDLVTDDSSAMERVGLSPRLIEGHADNLKITRAEDLPLARFYLDLQAQLC